MLPPPISLLPVLPGSQSQTYRPGPAPRWASAYCEASTQSQMICEMHDVRNLCWPNLHGRFPKPSRKARRASPQICVQAVCERPHQLPLACRSVLRDRLRSMKTPLSPSLPSFAPPAGASEHTLPLPCDKIIVRRLIRQATMDKIQTSPKQLIN